MHLYISFMLEASGFLRAGKPRHVLTVAAWSRVGMAQERDRGWRRGITVVAAHCSNPDTLESCISHNILATAADCRPYNNLHIPSATQHCSNGQHPCKSKDRSFKSLLPGSDSPLLRPAVCTHLPALNQSRAGCMCCYGQFWPFSSTCGKQRKIARC